MRWSKASFIEANKAVACPAQFYMGVLCGYLKMQTFKVLVPPLPTGKSLSWDWSSAVCYSTPMRLKRNFRLLLQLISFSITKTFHGLSQVSLICEANKPSNNKNLLRSWYSSLLSLSVNVWHGTLILASVISGWLPQTQHFTAARGLALSMLFLCSSQMTFKWMQVSS